MLIIHLNSIVSSVTQPRHLDHSADSNCRIFKIPVLCEGTQEVSL